MSLWGRAEVGEVAAAGAELGDGPSSRVSLAGLPWTLPPILGPGPWPTAEGTGSLPLGLRPWLFPSSGLGPHVDVAQADVISLVPHRVAPGLPR